LLAGNFLFNPTEAEINTVPGQFCESSHILLHLKEKEKCMNHCVTEDARSSNIFDEYCLLNKNIVEMRSMSDRMPDFNGTWHNNPDYPTCQIL
jgi:hypothetical protein